MGLALAQFASGEISGLHGVPLASTMAVSAAARLASSASEATCARRVNSHDAWSRALSPVTSDAASPSNPAANISPKPTITELPGSMNRCGSTMTLT